MASRMNCRYNMHQMSKKESYFHSFVSSRRQYMAASLVTEEMLIKSKLSTSNSTSLFTISQMDAFRSGKLPILHITSAFPPDVIDRFRLDSKALECFGGGIPSAGVAKGLGITHTIRKDVHQFWLSSPGEILNIDSTPFVGDLEIRKALFNSVEQLRRELVDGDVSEKDMTDEERLQKYYNSLWGTPQNHAQPIQNHNESHFNILEGIDRLHHTCIELSYLSYSKGSFYRRHVDRLQTKNDIKRDSARVVSFILYLGSDDDIMRTWDVNLDGGCLRVYGAENVKHLISQGVTQSSLVDTIDADLNIGEEFIDVAPLPGTLLIFDSSKVPHAVRETHRSRRCVVGWLGSLM